jgi:hypothetical protein
MCSTLLLERLILINHQLHLIKAFIKAFILDLAPVSELIPA